MSLESLARWFFRFLIVGVGTVVGGEALRLSFWPWRLTDKLQQQTLEGIDTNFVLVDVAYLSRLELAQLLERLGTGDPKGILLDITFEQWSDSRSDSLWRAVLCTVAARVPLYLAGNVEGEALHLKAKPVPASLAYFQDCAKLAYANLLFDGQVGGRCVRYTIPYLVAGPDTIPSLALAAAKLAVPALTYQTIPRDIIPIRYRGNVNLFYYLSGKELLQDTLPPAIVQGKVLFLGLVDPLYQVSEDIFFSPLGLKWGRLTPPDMYGVVIHANMASMYVAHRFWQVVPKWGLGLALGLILLLAGLLTDKLKRGRWLSVRALQLTLGTGGVFLAYALGAHGYWIEIEWYLLGLFWIGEVLLWTAPPCR